MSGAAAKILTVGTNRRYPDLGPRLAEQRELREARKAGPLQSLTPDQLRLHDEPVTTAPPRSQLWGRAWLRFGTVDVHATVRVDRWTRRAVGVEITIDDEVLRCWIWQGAVVPTPPPQ